LATVLGARASRPPPCRRLPRRARWRRLQAITPAAGRFTTARRCSNRAMRPGAGRAAPVPPAARRAPAGSGRRSLGGACADSRRGPLGTAAHAAPCKEPLIREHGPGESALRFGNEERGTRGLTVAAPAVPTQPFGGGVAPRGVGDGRFGRVPPVSDPAAPFPARTGPSASRCRSLQSGRDARAPGRDGRAPVGGEQPDAGGSRARGSLQSGRDARAPAARRVPGVHRVQVRVRPLQSGGRRQRIVDTQGAPAGETPALPGGGGPAAVLGAVCSFRAGRAAS
jgi:hypothetical protein